jgi:hypothetical protein
MRATQTNVIPAQIGKRRMGQAQRAHQCAERDGPAALGPSYRYFVPHEFPEYAAKTQPGSVNLKFLALIVTAP